MSDELAEHWMHIDRIDKNSRENFFQIRLLKDRCEILERRCESLEEALEEALKKREVKS
jgi:hypothetical protein